ncbi:hypothetical protein BDP81DRAFT_157002 [Colletotrichum phormii]|uniref:Uncharacterized protein n=1 Tax=Colletotrichum phormii TaxID=359342 RepID=A0AAI9ZXG8_9PEZI|nr:uncharacterized protein BDP81DRAFT_157002 [Colletotrichum phormii]KAK1640010.1 hypothetical protein BDP81DRAFT_157002 [Colletotrichum phormii]
MNEQPFRAGTRPILPRDSHGCPQIAPKHHLPSHFPRQPRDKRCTIHKYAPFHSPAEKCQPSPTGWQLLAAFIDSSTLVPSTRQVVISVLASSPRPDKPPTPSSWTPSTGLSTCQRHGPKNPSQITPRAPDSTKNPGAGPTMAPHNRPKSPLWTSFADSGPQLLSKVHGEHFAYLLASIRYIPSALWTLRGCRCLGTPATSSGYERG